METCHVAEAIKRAVLTRQHRLSQIQLDAVCTVLAVKAVETSGYDVVDMYNMMGISNIRRVWDWEIRVLQLLDWKIPGYPS